MSLPKLPPYEPPKFPLRTEAALAAARLRRYDGLRYLRAGLDRATDLMTECADGINNLVAEREGEEGGGDDDGDEERFGAQVDDLTARMERAVRRAIDAQEEAGGCDAVLGEIEERVARGGAAAAVPLGTQMSARAAATQRSRRRGGGSGSDSDSDADADSDVSMGDATSAAAADDEPSEPPPPFAPSAHFDAQMAARRDRYEARPLRARYAEHNRYVAFKSAVWVARHPGGEAVPHAATWFREQAGSPAPGTAAVNGVGAGEDGVDGSDDDDDLQTIRVKISTKCPLSLMEMRNPISNRRCAHAFERETIERYIRENKKPRGPGQPAGAPCPVAGCSQVLVLEDLYPNVALVRNIRRLQEAKLREGADGEEGSQGGAGGGEGFEDIDED
jgi:hypothetical protein